MLLIKSTISQKLRIAQKKISCAKNYYQINPNLLCVFGQFRIKNFFGVALWRPITQKLKIEKI